MIEYNRETAINEFKLRGEYQLCVVLENTPLSVVFDVGCNVGEWSHMMRSFQLEADIHMFELIPQTFQKLIRNDIDEKMFPNSYGLSNKVDQQVAQYVTDNDRVSTLVQGILHDNREIKPVLVSTGDLYCSTMQIPYIDFLKIDTEGHELQVLQGFYGMITSGRVGIIQFEHGFVDVLSRNLLIDFYQLLEPHGYKIGKLTQKGVNFTPFRLFDETFSGADYIAVHTSSDNLIPILSNFPHQ